MTYEELNEQEERDRDERDQELPQDILNPRGSFDDQFKMSEIVWICDGKNVWAGKILANVKHACKVYLFGNSVLNSIVHLGMSYIYDYDLKNEIDDDVTRNMIHSFKNSQYPGAVWAIAEQKKLAIEKSCDTKSICDNILLSNGQYIF